MKKIALLALVPFLCWSAAQAAEVQKIPPAEMQKIPAAEPQKMQTFTLRDAMASAYLGNPALLAERAILLAEGENVAVARSGYRPALAAGASHSTEASDGNASGSLHADPTTLQLILTQPLYSGGSTGAAVRGAESAVAGARARLTEAEQSALLEAVTAYMDVLRDAKILDLNVNNEKVLGEHLDASQARLKLGAITRTDVSQAEARLAEAEALRVSAEGALKSSRARLEKAVGTPPGELTPPALEADVPGTLDEALAEAETRNPLLEQARRALDTAHETTAELEGGLRPAVDLSGSLSRTYDPAGTNDSHTDTRALTVAATVPIYPAGGATHARIRQSRQVEVQMRRQTESAGRSVRESVISAWEALGSASARYVAQDAQVKAERMAREGVATEAKYGSRTILDLLDAEQEYLNAEVERADSERDRTVAAYALLSTVGRLTAADLKLDVPLYNPEPALRASARKWAGTQIPAE